VTESGMVVSVRQAGLLGFSCPTISKVYREWWAVVLWAFLMPGVGGECQTVSSWSKGNCNSNNHFFFTTKLCRRASL